MGNWQTFIQNQQQQPYFVELNDFLTQEYALGKIIYPPKGDIFRAFELTPIDKVNVVIIGQDPYHGEGQAHGLAFSVKTGVKIPPSLANIYKELNQDIDDFVTPSHGNLTKWAEQGVLMLNTVLTVEQSLAHSHAKAGWETFTDNVLYLLNRSEKPIVFVLWGSHAIKKGRLINAEQHTVLSGPHPSPLSAYRGFFGCHHFSKINELLIKNGTTPIDWQV
ncbi:MULTISPECIES: uracil-DNA glycosylase [Shewanella]|uniref:Uracil-DNA glycosylase n=1 Tax=Shewanella holmiensis TaxID=2952222 RepID=A0A9X2WK72_9GAMM|nr:MULTISPECIES: uracil-DNA glycosylase [Shewanella]MCT7940944.1 uracil-DNA glycosylase [Shewanella holmiensis]MDP5146197.1 uracil-DNA glycosylase [Shewanella sp. ULN5]